MPASAIPLAHLLIVDDEGAQMKALCDTLREQGYDTTGFTAAAPALAALQEAKFDLLLADLMMPEMDGIALLQAALKAQPDLVGIIMTGQGTIATAVEAMQVGALDYILKPFKLSVILPVLSRALAMQRLRAENAELEQRLREHAAELEVANRELQETNQRLKETQTYLVHAEKMASLGQLVAGIAHEINNPLAFVMNNIYTITNTLEQTAREGVNRLSEPTLRRLEKAQDRLSNMKEGTERVKELVLALRTFSRLDEGALKTADVHENIDTVLRFLAHKMEERIRVEKHYCPDGTLYCYVGQLNQVFMNVLANAVDAIKGQGEIAISTYREGEMFCIVVRDSGEGIPQAIRQRIFEPFFTTKPVGQGTGLGLAISYGIIQAHQGVIEVDSQEGEGTTLVIKVPTNLEARTTRLDTAAPKGVRWDDF